MTTEFRWLIEAPGGKYLAARHVGMADDFAWTTDHDQAIALRSEDQACRFLWSFRQMDRDLNKGALFAFETTLGPARAVEHGWIGKE